MVACTTTEIVGAGRDTPSTRDFPFGAQCASDEQCSAGPHASANAPATQDEAAGCMIASSGRYLSGGTTAGAELSTKRGSGLIVPAGGSAFVMLVTGSKTGAFALTVTTETLGVGAGISIGTEVDDSASMPIFVSGVMKTPKALPSPGSWSCGESVETVRSYGPEAYAYFEVKNEGDRDASVALSLDGQPDHSLAFFAFASQTAPSSIDDVKGCTVSASGDFLSGGQTRGAELSAKRGGSLVVPAHESTWVMLATGGKTGAFTVMARTEALGDADKASIEVPTAKGATATKSVLVSGASKTPPMMPSPGPWSCGDHVSAVRSYGPEAFAYVEVKNTSDTAASVGLTLAGEPDYHLAMFAYASATPPASAGEAKSCLTAGSGDYLSGGTVLGVELSARRRSSVVVGPKSSVYVLLATGAKTGAFEIVATRE